MEGSLSWLLLPWGCLAALCFTVPAFNALVKLPVVLLLANWECSITREEIIFLLNKY